MRITNFEGQPLELPEQKEVAQEKILESLCIVNVSKTALPNAKLKSILKIQE